MSKQTERRHRGRHMRKTLRLDRAWREQGKVEGRTENDLAWRLGQCWRMGLGPASERARKAQAARLGLA